MTTQESKHGQLILVATPIGNLGDVSARAIDTFKECDILVCEDTRVTRVLLSHFGLRPQELWTYHEHNALHMRPKIVDAVREGKRVALVSDAGTPLISDPGHKLVRALQEEGLPVTAVPGPCAAITALILSGLPTDQFFFGGFPPRKSSARQDFFRALKNVPGTLIFYEAPRRLRATLQDAYEVLGTREMAFAREITKKFEEVQRGAITLFKDREDLDTLKGELVLLIGPKLETAQSGQDARAYLEDALTHLSLRDAVREVAQTLDLPRQDVYDLALDIRKASKGKERV